MGRYGYCTDYPRDHSSSVWKFSTRWDTVCSRICRIHRRSIQVKMMTKQYPAPGFLDRLQKICEAKGITMDQLAEIAEVTVPIFEAYATGEVKLDEKTLHRILDYSGVDWMWLEHGYDPEDLKVFAESKKIGLKHTC